MKNFTFFTKSLVGVLLLLLGQASLAQLPGSNDPTFNVADSVGTFDGPVNVLARQADGKLLVGGDFQTFNGRSRNGLARLLPDGSLDATFQVGSGFKIDLFMVG
jgi:hypothetical protein